MTKQEFDIQQAKILETLPQEFHAPISMLAWEQGHSAGYQEVISYLEEFVDELAPAIQAFQARIKEATNLNYSSFFAKKGIACQ